MKQNTPPPNGEPERDLFSRAARALPSSGTVGFRLSEECFAILSDRAALHGLSVHLYARSVVLEVLFCDETFALMTAKIAEVQAEARELRQDLAFSMKTLLMTAGKIPENDAADWVKRNFKL